MNANSDSDTSYVDVSTCLKNLVDTLSDDMWTCRSGFNRGGPTDYGTNRGSLIKQTYSVFVETPRGRRKWHLSEPASRFAI